MSFDFVAFAESDREAGFALYAQSLKPFVDQTFGWNQAFQQQRFAEQYPTDSLCWIQAGAQRLGLLCDKTQPEELHLHLLLLYPEFQAQGLGQQIMQGLQQQAQAQNLPLRLSSFKCNQRAVKFYQRLGYQLISQDEYFYDFEWLPGF